MFFGSHKILPNKAAFDFVFADIVNNKWPKWCKGIITSLKRKWLKTLETGAKNSPNHQKCAKLQGTTCTGSGTSKRTQLWLTSFSSNTSSNSQVLPEHNYSKSWHSPIKIIVKYDIFLLCLHAFPPPPQKKDKTFAKALYVKTLRVIGVGNHWQRRAIPLPLARKNSDHWSYQNQG